MKKNFTYCLMALLIFISFVTPVNAQVNGTAAKPLVSNAEKPVYYYIESASNGTVKMGTNNGLNLLGNLIYVPTTTSGVRLKHDLLANITGTTINLNADVALWQILNEGGLLKLKNKATGMYMDASDKAVTTTTYSFLATAYNTTPTQYYIKNSNTNPSNAWTLNNLDKWGYFTPSENSQIAWYFIVAPGSEANYADALNAQIKIDLQLKITEATNRLSGTKEGQDPGTFSAGSRNTLQNAIVAAQDVYDASGSTSQDYVNATNALSSAITTYNSAVVLPQLSTEGNERWYFIQGTRPANTYMTTMGVGGKINDAPVIPNDSQLWKLVENTTTANASTGFTLVNKLTGEYINTDVASGVEFVTSATMPGNKLRFIVSNELTGNVYRFWIENAVSSTPALRFHAGGSGNGNNAMNYTGSAADNCTWLFMDYSVALRVFLQTAISSAQSLIANTFEGAYFGQYSAESRTALSEATAVAQAIYADNTKTDDEIKSATLTINAAIASYKASINGPVSLISASGSNYRWYWIKSTSAHAYAQNKVISAGTRILGEKFTFEPKAAEVSDVQLFRFELTEDQTKVLNIINKAGGYMANNGAIATTSTADNNFALNLLAGGYSFNIKPTSLNAIHAQETGAHIVNWAGDAGTSSAWVFEYALETPRITTALNNSEMSEYKIKVSDRIISVEGESEFEIYSVTGQKLDKQFRLATGVYFVKLNNATVKVIVR